MTDRISTFKSLLILFSYRKRLFEAVSHDVHQRYVGSVFGITWAILYPLLQLAIYAGLYSFIFKVRPVGLTEMGYVLLVFSGLAPLMVFNESLAASISSFSSNKNLLLNTVFPAELIPLRAALAAQVPSFIGLILTLILGFILGRTSWHAVILVPVYWFLLIMFALGVGWFLSLVSIVARDIQHGLSLVTMLIFVLSPFAYTPDMVPAIMRPILLLNPLSYFVLTFQKLICYGTWPEPIAAVGSIGIALTTFIAGFIFFKRAKNVFFDYA